MSKLYLRSQLSWNAPHASHPRTSKLYKNFSNYKSSKFFRKGTERVESNPGNSGTQNQPTISYKSQTTYFRSNNNVAQIQAGICVTQTQKLEGAEWIESHLEIFVHFYLIGHFVLGLDNSCHHQPLLARNYRKTARRRGQKCTDFDALSWPHVGTNSQTQL